MSDDTSTPQDASAPTPSPVAPAQPTVYVMSEAHAREVAALQHLAGWHAAEVARLEHELGYVRGAAAHTRAGLHAYLARVFGLDAAHEPGLTIDLERRIITRPAPPTPPTTAEPPEPPPTPTTTPPTAEE